MSYVPPTTKYPPMPKQRGTKMWPIKRTVLLYANDQIIEMIGNEDDFDNIRQIDLKNCPNCGAPITSHECEYCGTVFNLKKKMEV